MTIYELIQDLKALHEAQKSETQSVKTTLEAQNAENLEKLKEELKAQGEAQKETLSALIDEKEKNATAALEANFANLTANLRSDNERLLGEQLTIMANFSQD